MTYHLAFSSFINLEDIKQDVQRVDLLMSANPQQVDFLRD